jgi:hypothetical protein
MIGGWVETARGVSLAQVATELGLSVLRRGWSPCPACGAELRGDEDRRGPVGATSDGRAWRCHRCSEGGSVVDLAGAALDAPPCGPAVRSWFAARGWCEPAPDGPPPPRVVPKPPPPPQPQPDPPDPAEVADLWARCPPVLDDDEVTAWLRSRGLDAIAVEDRDLARALPADGLPGWARWWPRHGARCVVPTWGPDGALVALRARVTELPFPGGPKALHAIGAPLGILADGTALAMLRGDAWVGEAGPVMVIIAEGEPDWLTWATWFGEADSAPAVFGLPGSGSWSSAIASRIPDGAVVAVRTDDDVDGRAYSAAIVRDLARRCSVRVAGSAP